MTLDNLLLKKFASRIDIDHLKESSLQENVSRTFRYEEKVGMTVYTLGPRLDYRLKNGKSNALMIMKYKGNGEFVLEGDWDEMEMGDNGLPNGEKAAQNQGWNYIMIPYNQLDKIAPGFSSERMVEEMIKTAAKVNFLEGADIPSITGIIAAVSSWAIASNYINKYGIFQPLEVLPDHAQKERYPSKLLDFSKRRTRIKIDILNYIRGK